MQIFKIYFLNLNRRSSLEICIDFKRVALILFCEKRKIRNLDHFINTKYYKIIQPDARDGHKICGAASWVRKCSSLFDFELCPCSTI